ncbi:MAG: hypothetical protein LBQ82_07050 [Treponema sp.]|nr:hypothetical protein [Treponema sp.]
MAFPERIFRNIKDGFQKMNDEKKRQVVLICTAGVVVLLVLSVVLSKAGSGKEELPAGPDRLNIRIAIPPDELFLPDEPDFVPGVQLQREQRSSWTEEDAAIFWRDPLRNGEEQWREKIEAAVDELLERVP